MRGKEIEVKHGGGAEKASAIPGGGSSMRSRLATILGAVMVVALAFVWNSCGQQPGCPTCGTTTSGAYGVIDIIPVPEHNPTGEPGGPFNSFDISWFDPNRRVVYTSDRIGLAIVVTDTVKDEAVNTIGGANEVTLAGNNASPCLPGIPSIITGIPDAMSRGLTRFGCRNLDFFSPFGLKFPGYGDNGLFGGFVGAQCCASRANGVNPISGPDGNLVTPDGKTLFVGNGSASVVVFDLSGGVTAIPTVIADFPTGTSPGFDSTTGVAPCIATWNGGAGSDPTCADDRADEMAYGTLPGGCTPSAANPACRAVFAVSNGDPAQPFYTLADVTAIVTRAAPGNATGYCLPVTTTANYTPLSIPAQASYKNPKTGNTQAFPAGPNFPTCILGQVYYDGSAVNDTTVKVDDGSQNLGASNPCPFVSTSVSTGVSGKGVGVAGADVPCHHSAVVNSNTGVFVTPVAGIQTAGAGQQGEVAVAGMGATVFNPFGNKGKGTFYEENLNCTVATNLTGPGAQSSVAVGCIDEIDPLAANGPVVINVIPVINCMPAGITQGPGTDFLIGCGGHDGTQFPPLMIIFNGMTDQIISGANCTVLPNNCITQTGGTDEVWYNPGDNKYYTAGRDMPNGPVMGVIDAGRRLWLVNVPTGSNAHSIAVDQFNNHILVPLQAGPRCTTQSSNGCIAVYAQQ
jgi:hypothetical protein